MVMDRRAGTARTLMSLVAGPAALLAGALAAALTGALWLLVIAVVLSLLVPYYMRRRRHGYRRILAWVFGTMLALLVVWVVMIVVAVATGQIE